MAYIGISARECAYFFVKGVYFRGIRDGGGDVEDGDIGWLFRM